MDGAGPDDRRVLAQPTRDVRHGATRGRWLPVVVGGRVPQAARTGVAGEVIQRPCVRVPRERVRVRVLWPPAAERALARDVPGLRGRSRDREARPGLLEPGLRLAGALASGAAVEQDPDRFELLEGGQRTRVRGLGLNRIRRQRDPRDPHRHLVDRGRASLDLRGVRYRRLVRDVQLEEVVPAVERLRVERVDVGSVREREPPAVGAGEARGEIRAVTAGLLVRPLAGHVRRHVDLVDERVGRQRVGHRRAVVVVSADLGDQVRRLAVEDLVVLAGLVAALDPLVGPVLPLGL